MQKAYVVLDDTPVEEGVLRLKPGMNLATGERQFKEAFGQLTSLDVHFVSSVSVPILEKQSDSGS